MPLPIQLIATLLGLPEGDEERLFRWSEAAIPGATDWSDDERDGAAHRDDRRAARPAPRPDGPSRATTSCRCWPPTRRTATSLTDDELGMFLIQLLVAGNETTRNAISGALVALAAAPRAARPPRRRPALLPTAVEEVLRWTTPVTSFLRTAVADTELGGVGDRGGRPAAAHLRGGQPRRGRVRPHRGHVRRRAAPRTTTSPSATAPLLPRRRAGPPRAVGRAGGRRRALVAPDGRRARRAQRLVGHLRHPAPPRSRWSAR